LIDTSEIIGDDIYKQTYSIVQEMDSENIDSIFLETDSLFSNIHLIEFPQYFELDNAIYGQGKYYEKENPKEYQMKEKLSIINLKSDTVELKSFDSDFILLDFWFTRCPGCIKGIPSLNQIYNSNKPEFLQVIGVNPIDTSVLIVKDFIHKTNIDYPVYLCDAEMVRLFKVEYYPTYILIDNRNGDLLNSKKFKHIEDLKIEIEKLNNEN
jgi:thiol-disulfide isomerase/thioredoxin